MEQKGNTTFMRETVTKKSNTYFPHYSHKVVLGFFLSFFCPSPLLECFFVFHNEPGSKLDLWRNCLHLTHWTNSKKRLILYTTQMTQIKSCWKTEATLQTNRKTNHTHDKAGPFMTGGHAVIFEILLQNDLQELEVQYKSKRLLHSSVLKQCCNYVLKLCRPGKNVIVGLIC